MVRLLFSNVLLLQNKKSESITDIVFLIFVSCYDRICLPNTALYEGGSESLSRQDLSMYR